MTLFRINLSSAIVAMVGVEPKLLIAENTNNLTDLETLLNRTNDEQFEIIEGEFDWDTSEQGLLMGSYYWGYTAAQIPAAWLASKYGFRMVFGVSMLVSGVITIIFPLCAFVHVYLALAARVLIGIFHAVALPAMTGAWAIWAPPMEITK